MSANNGCSGTLLLLWFCLRMIPGRCSSVVTDHAHSPDCPTSCRAHQFCDPIEQRCSPCSPRVCQLKLAEGDCHPFCTDYRVRFAEENGSSWESGWSELWLEDSRQGLGETHDHPQILMEKMCKSRVPVITVTVLQLVSLLLILTLLVSVMIFYLQYRALLGKFRKPKNASVEVTQVAKRNNLDIEMSILRCKGGYNQDSVCPPRAPTPQTPTMPQTSPARQTPPTPQTSATPQTFLTSEFGSVQPQRCNCDEVSSRWDTDTWRGMLYGNRVFRNPDPVDPGQIDSSLLESRSLLTGCFIQPSPLSQDM